MWFSEFFVFFFLFKPCCFLRFGLDSLFRFDFYEVIALSKKYLDLLIKITFNPTHTTYTSSSLTCMIAHKDAFLREERKLTIDMLMLEDERCLFNRVSWSSQYYIKRLTIHCHFTPCLLLEQMLKDLIFQMEHFL